MKEEGREVHYELYRRCTLGMTLTDALDEMVTNGELTPTIAMKVLAQFDKVPALAKRKSCSQTPRHKLERFLTARVLVGIYLSSRLTDPPNTQCMNEALKEVKTKTTFKVGVVLSSCHKHRKRRFVLSPLFLLWNAGQPRHV